MRGRRDCRNGARRRTVAGGATAAYRAGGAAGVAKAGVGRLSPLRRAAASLKQSFASGGRAATRRFSRSPAPAERRFRTASRQIHGAPAWAQRMQRSQTISHGVTAADHAMRSGDRPSGGHPSTLPKENEACSDDPPSATARRPTRDALPAAGQVWDDRIGSARVQAKNWRLAFFGTLALSGGLAGGLVWQSARGTVTPWVVQVDKLGQAQAVAPAAADYQPTDPQIARHLAHFIKEVRSIPADPVVLRQNWLDAYKYVTDKGALALNDYARANDPFSKIGKSPSLGRGDERDPRLRRQLPRRMDRAPLRRRRARRDRTLERDPHHRHPAADRRRRLNKNPLGVYVDALNWSKELG